jgi:hypothetical protein
MEFAEYFLAAEHPRRAEFEALTQAEEEARLYLRSGPM